MLPDVTGSSVLNIKATEKKNKMPGVSGLVTTAAIDTEASEIENRISNHEKFITNPKFNKLIKRNLVTRFN